jgi:sec-independent protein translocase protein TatC
VKWFYVGIVLVKKIYHLYTIYFKPILFTVIMALLGRTKNNGDKEMSFLQHLEELRWHIVRSVVAIAVGASSAFIFKNVLFNSIMLAPTRPDFFTNRVLCKLGDLLHSSFLCINSGPPLNLVSLTMAGQFSTHVTVSIIAGVVIAFPYIIWEFWKFFKPALKPNERKHAGSAVTSASILFFIGVAFGYYLIVPFSISFLTTYRVSETVVNQINIMSYISTISQVSLASGVIFELPIVAFFLTKIGIITPKFMKQYRRHAIVVIFIIGAIITPPDIVSQTMVSVPLVFLYEFSIWVSAGVMRKKRREEERLNLEQA